MRDDGYEKFSFTSSGWQISTNPTAKPAKRWRAEHLSYGVRYFAEHDDILPFTCEHMIKQNMPLIKEVFKKGKP